MVSCTMDGRIYQIALQTTTSLPCSGVQYMLLIIMAPSETRLSVVSRDGMGVPRTGYSHAEAVLVSAC